MNDSGSIACIGLRLCTCVIGNWQGADICRRMELVDLRQECDLFRLCNEIGLYKGVSGKSAPFPFVLLSQECEAKAYAGNGKNEKDESSAGEQESMI